MDGPQEVTEYAYTTVFEDGTRDWITGLGTDRDRALGQFRTLERDDTMRLVFLSRRVTDWTEADPATPA